MSIKNNIILLKKHGYRLIPVDKNGKKPFLKNWNKLDISEDDLLSYAEQGHNIGIIIGSDDLVVDVDKKHGGLESFKQLQKDLGIKIIPTVATANGGFHVYFKKERDAEYQFKISEYPGIDFLGTGRCCIIPGSTINDTKYSWYNDPPQLLNSQLPEGLVEKLRYTNKKPLNNQKSKHEEDEYNNKKRQLEAIDPDVPYDVWRSIGMSLHSWDNSEKSLELWKKWSSKGEKFKDGECEKKWDSFNSTKEITIKTLDYYYNAAIKAKALEAVHDKIKNIEDISEISQIQEDIQNINYLNTAEKKNLEVLMKKSFKQNLSINYTNKELKEITNPVKPLKKPDWCDNWVYVNSHREYFNIKRQKFYDKTSFNALCAKELIGSMEGNKQNAHDFISKNGFLNVADTAEYLPQEDELLIEREDGSYVINTYNGSERPAETEITEDKKKHINYVLKHLKRLICNDNKYLYNILINWLAHNIQYPGKKIRWAIIIKSLPGVGKSFIGELLITLMGGKNVKKISPPIVLDKFNEWATNTCVNILEEIKITGANRYEFLNNIKSVITDKSISINGKFKKPYTTLNTTNYIGFTNHDDCVPIERGDRRWCIIKSEIESDEDLKKATGVEKPDDYYIQLFQMLDDHADVLYTYFNNYKLDEAIINTHTAPVTDYKKIMENTEDAMKPGLDDIKELIEKQSKYYNSEVIISSELYNDLDEMHLNDGDTRISNIEKNLLLKRLGYSIIYKEIRINGEKKKKVWARKMMTTDEVRRSLKL